MKRFLSLVLFAGLLAAQTAKYPDAIATDADLKVAANRVQTTLRGGITAAATTIVVASATGIVPNMLLTIDAEIVSVTSLSGTSLVVVRGFDGTVAAAHSTGRTVSALIDAWHHNSVAAEVKAIQTLLGPNLLNVPSTVGGDVHGPAAGTGGEAAVLDATGKVLSRSALTGVVKSAAGVQSAVTGTGSNCVHVDGTSDACNSTGADVVGPAAGTGGEISILDPTGKILSRSDLTGVLKVTAGVPSVVTGTGSYCVHVDGTSASCSSGSGDFVGPGVAVSTNFVSFSGTTGKLGQDSGFKGSDFAVTAKGVTNGDTHDHSGGDGAAITEAALSFSDLATLDASIARHGFLKKLNGDPSYYMNGEGAWTVPGGGGDVLGPATATVIGYFPLWGDITGNALTGGVAAPTGAVVGTTDTQTLTNKTLTVPILGYYTIAGLPTPATAGRLAIVTNAATSAVCSGTPGTALSLCRDSGAAWVPVTSLSKADIGLGNADNTSDATKNAASATLTNKTLTLPIITAYGYGESLPANGTAGRIIVLTSANNPGACTDSREGTSLALCRDSGTAWTSLGDGGSGGGGGATDTAGLTDFKAAAAGIHLVIPAGRARIGNYAPVAIAEGTADFTAGAGSVKVFIDASNNLICHMATGIAATTGGSLTCSNVATPAYPENSIPIASVSVAADTFYATVTSDDRAFLSTRGVSAGTGISIADAGGVASIGIDTATVPQLGAGSNDFTGALSALTLQLLSGTEGTCDVTLAGKIVFVLGAGSTASTLKACGKNASDVYAWVALTTWP